MNVLKNSLALVLVLGVVKRDEAAGTDFYEQMTTFTNIAGIATRCEDFDRGSLTGCTHHCETCLLSSSENGNCPPLNLLPGFSISTGDGDSLMMLGPGEANSRTSFMVAPMSRASSTVLTFDDGDGLNKVSLDVFSDDFPVSITAYDAAFNFLGSSSVSAAGFFGIVSDTPVRRIEFDQNGIRAEILDNICFDFNKPPEAICQDIVLASPTPLVASSLDGGSTDDTTAPADLLFSVDSTGPFPIGNTTVVLTVTDEANTTDTCEAVVSVIQKTCHPSTNTRFLLFEDDVTEQQQQHRRTTGNIRSSSSSPRLLNGWFACGTTTHCVKERSTCEINEVTNEHYCQCLDGYDGIECRPMDECETSFPCPGGSKCVDMDPPIRYKCVCESGYTPVLPDANAFDESNVPLEYRPTQCLDRLECEEAESPCHQHATCENTIGSFECKCKDGLVGNGVTTCELPETVVTAGTDPSAPSEICVTDEDCTDGANMQCVESECICLPGYAQVGPNCQNEVHCDSGGFNNDCHRRATCTEESGFPGFSCHCIEGWEDAFQGANGKSCRVIPPPETEAPPEPITEAAAIISSNGVGPHPNRPTVFPPTCFAIDENCDDDGQCCSGTCE